MVNDPRLDNQNIESVGNAEILGRNTCRRLSPTTVEYVQLILEIPLMIIALTSENGFSFPPQQNVTRGSQNSSSSGIHQSSSPPGVPAKTMPEEYAERLTNSFIRLTWALKGKSINHPYL